ncbi:MAG: hypothetical protein QNJ15_12075 [Erythrobacter sp.]|nr:hypothetical protein [Erythrobacter sp.]
MDVLTQIALSSDAAILAMVGAAFMALAALCAVMERRRNKGRSLARLERVGWVPWTPLFVGCMIIGGGCLAMSLPVVLGSL